MNPYFSSIIQNFEVFDYYFYYCLIRVRGDGGGVNKNKNINSIFILLNNHIEVWEQNINSQKLTSQKSEGKNRKKICKKNPHKNKHWKKILILQLHSVKTDETLEYILK